MSLDLAAMRAALLLKQHELLVLDATGREATEVVELDQSRVGRLSRMDALQGQAMSKEAQRRRQLELKQISAALQRIDDDEYGECLECGEAIKEARLQADPSTPLCIRCAAAHEE